MVKILKSSAPSGEGHHWWSFAETGKGSYRQTQNSADLRIVAIFAETALRHLPPTCTTYREDLSILISSLSVAHSTDSQLSVERASPEQGWGEASGKPYNYKSSRHAGMGFLFVFIDPPATCQTKGFLFFEAMIPWNILSTGGYRHEFRDGWKILLSMK